MKFSFREKARIRGEVICRENSNLTEPVFVGMSALSMRLFIVDAILVQLH